MNPNVTARLIAPDGLATRLHALRKASGLSQPELARECGGWAQSKVSRIEGGQQLPSVDDVKVWSAACGASDQSDALVDAAEDAEGVMVDWRRRARKGHAAVQADYNELAAAARLVRNFEVAVVPGVLQTYEYAVAIGREVIALHGDPDGKGPEGFAAKRMERTGYVADPARRFEFLVTEEVLTRFTCSPAEMRQQLYALLRAAERPNVRFGVIPAAGQVAMTTNEPFVFYDDTLWIEPTAAEGSYDGEVAAKYERMLTAHWADAVEGNEARALIVAAADALR